MALNAFEVFPLYRSFSTRADGLAEIAKHGLGDLRVRFFKRLLQEEAFDNMGDNSEFVREARRFPNLCGDLQIEKLAAQVAKDAELVLLSNDQSMVDAGFWEHVNIPGVEMTVAKCGDNIRKKGWHLFHGGIGAGKTENVLLPEARRHKNHDRALVIVPNVIRAKELAKELGWAHYHNYGTSPADIKKAIASHDQLVICAASIRQISVEGDFFPYRHIYVDELCEILRYAEKQNDPKEAKDHFWQSLDNLWRLARYADRFLGFTADAPKAYVVGTMEKAAREFNRAAFYYKTTESFAKYQTYSLMASEEDLIWSVAQKINDGLSAWGYVDFSSYNAALPNFANILRKLCPGKKIEWFDKDKLDDVMGQPIRELGLVEYIKQKRREGELDCFISSPFARSQYSILYGKEEEDLIFDFSFACLRSADVGTPQDGDQGLGRSRQTKQKLVYIKEAIKGCRVVEKGDGLKSLEKNFGKSADLSKAEAWEKIAWHNRVATQQYTLANKASRKWLFKLLVEDRGAKVVQPTITIPKDDLDAYLKIAREVREEAQAVEKGKPLENNTTLRHKKLSSAYRWSGSSWDILRYDDYDENELQSALTIDGTTAERIFQIFQADHEYRQYVDRGFLEAYWTITGYLLDLILFELFAATDLHKQANFFHWFLHGDESTWFSLSENDFYELGYGLRHNFEYVRRTINPPIRMAGSIPGFLKAVGECLGLEIVSKVNKPDRMIWRDALFTQYKLLKGAKVAEKYELAEKKLKQKLAQPNFNPSGPEAKFIDTLPDVFRVTKKKTVNRRVVDVYQHYYRALSQSGPRPPRKVEKEDLQDRKEALAS